MELIVDVINHIVAAGTAVGKDTDIFKDFTPATPDDVIGVFEYNGTGPAPFTDMSVRSVQITVRSKSANQARQKAWQIYKCLYSENGLATIGSRKCIVSMRNTPIKIDVDSQGRTIFAFNCGITTNFD